MPFLRAVLANDNVFFMCFVSNHTYLADNNIVEKNPTEFQTSLHTNLHYPPTQHSFVQANVQTAKETNGCFYIF